MKKNKIINIILILILVIIPILARADSGWDSSYSGGGSSYHSSSGSSYHSSSGSSSSSYSISGSSRNATMFDIIFISIVLFIMIYAFISTIRSLINMTNTSNTLKTNANYLSQEEVNKVDPTIVLDDFYKKIFNEYVDIQVSWMNFDYETLRKNLSDELFNNYKMQLETLKLKNQKNIMSDFNLISAGITSINQTNKTIEIQMELHVTQTDYVINETSQKVIHGDPSLTSDVIYKLTLEKSSNKNNNIKYCPNCGHELNDSASLVCPYCNSVIVKESNYYILTKKEVKNQRWL